MRECIPSVAYVSMAEDILSFFLCLPEASQTIRVFDLKGMYVVCGDHAKIIAEGIGASPEIDNNTGMATLSLTKHQFDEVLKAYLIDRSEFKMELYDTSFGSWMMKKSVSLPAITLIEIHRSASPGSLGDFEEELMRQGCVLDDPIIMSIMLGYREGQRTVGMALLNKAKHEIAIAECNEDEGYRNTECIFVQLGIKECLLITNERTNDAERVKSIAHQCHVMIIERPRGANAGNDLFKDLSRICKEMSVQLHRGILSQPRVYSAVAGLLGYCHLSNVKYDLRVQKFDGFMRLNKATQSALNVFPDRSDAPPTHSLFGWLNRCKTPMAKRQLKTWILQPLMNIEEMDVRYDVVEAFLQNSGLREDIAYMLRGTIIREVVFARLRESCLGMPDVSRLVQRLESRKIDLSEMYKLYGFSRKLHPIAKRLSEYGGQHRSLFKERYLDALLRLTDDEHLRRFEKFWEVAIDISRLPEEFLLSPKYDKKLMEVHALMTQTEMKILTIGQCICRDLGLIWERTGKLAWYKCSHSQKRCLKMSCKEERSLRSRLQSEWLPVLSSHLFDEWIRFTVLETLKDGVKFTNSKLNTEAEELQRLKTEYEGLQGELMRQVRDIAASFLEVFEDASALIAELDILYAFATTAASAPVPYVRPKVLESNEGQMNIKGGRHPLVEAQMEQKFIRNNSHMIRGDSWFQFITGPNMGGKSTYIRQIGCFVPCEEAVLLIRDAIYARVGAGDSQQHGISTFMAEMLDTASIFQGATDRSLVIIDELGRGTSTCDGLGLAWSISHHLMEWIRCPTLFATHFHELSSIQHDIGVKHLHVHSEIDEAARLVMRFQVMDGPCNASFGIEVARNAGFPPSVIAMAEDRLKILETSP